jgi:hypothetical protein
MNLHKTDPGNLKPCPHMQTLVSAWVDGKLKGLARWYTEWHVKHCPQCQSAIPFLRALHERLQTLGSQDAATQELPEVRWSRIKEAWDKVDVGKES